MGFAAIKAGGEEAAENVASGEVTGGNSPFDI